MSAPSNTPIPAGGALWDLPPLILHPFNEHVPPSALLENSKAALMLNGLIPDDGTGQDELSRRVLAGRFSEVRMLYFLGKDIFRWMGQCLEWSSRVAELQSMDLRAQSFAGLLAQHPPAAVAEKLVRWGVADHLAIFARAIGLHSVFASAPTFEALSEPFLRNYHRYADFLFHCYMNLEPHHAIDARQFHFELYASGEYSRLLEHEWGTGDGG